jgi:hypothetical protein
MTFSNQTRYGAIYLYVYRLLRFDLAQTYRENAGATPG